MTWTEHAMGAMICKRLNKGSFILQSRPIMHVRSLTDSHFTTSISRPKSRAKVISWPHGPEVCESCWNNVLRRLHSRAIYASQAIMLPSRIQAMPNLVIICDSSRSLHHKSNCQLPKPHGKNLRLELSIAVIHQHRVLPRTMALRSLHSFTLGCLAT